MRFKEFSLSQEILKGIKDMGFEEASPIQVGSIVPLMEGKDVIGQAQTGTGKTAAFGIPILEQAVAKKGVQGLVLCPTRELCIQVAEEITKLGKYKKNINVLPIYGGTSIDRQLRSLKKGVEIVVGTPGRVMDLMRRNALKFDNLEIAVLDEADEMFDMGFRDDMKFILESTNEEVQTCFFSATMGKEILEFSRIYQTEPEIVKIKHKEVTVENISQYYIEMKNNMKTEILSRLLDIYNPKLAIVFCNTKRKVDDLVLELAARGYSADALHGDLKQNQRYNVMSKFRKNTIDILIATDVAARGIDVENVDIVFNYDLPQDEEYYVHRIGRTARAGRKGLSFTFVVGRDVYKLKDIKRYTKADIEYMEIPTISDIDKSIENNLVDKLISDLEIEQDYTKEKIIIDKLLQLGYGSVEISMLLLRLLQKSQGMKSHEALESVDFNKRSIRENNRPGNRGDQRDVRNQNPKEKTKRKRSNSPKSKIFINKGKRDGITPLVVLAAFHQDTSVPIDAIGDIRIQNNFTFVDVDNKFVNKAVQELDGKTICKKVVSVEKSGSN